MAKRKAQRLTLPRARKEARETYQKYDYQKLIRTRLSLEQRLIAIDKLIQEAGGASTITKRDKAQWDGDHLTFFPPRSLGRPTNS